MRLFQFFTLTCLILASTFSLAQDANLKKILSERLPSLPKIEEISKTPMPGVFEIRVQGNEIFYADAKGDFLIQGALIDTKQKRNLTEERTEKLSAVPFDSLPLKFAITQVRGNGKRKLVVFSDPNCGYCKRFERDLQKIDNVTLYHLMYPVLGEDSRLKSRNIACAKDRAKTWNDWMLQGITPPTVSCDNHNIDAIVEFGRKNRINGTPTMFVTDGTRVPGAIDAAQIEALLNAVKP
ncbi:DsbC family protein [Limnohabitans sp. MMS-10A-178]|uniref:DsbC family protein n=1 Tax=Limnohabitans sp. MMS-10A-178 TaxID=1835767 RepID=UPI000D3AC76F|nr:DsbC family protein [Limnohabitans sp. MMS-10A-178]PUE17232.1 disulfide isomerase [Limnohabitans sp. MMS-10A-178]